MAVEKTRRAGAHSRGRFSRETTLEDDVTPFVSQDVGREGVPGRPLLGEILVRHGVLTSENLAIALAQQAASGGRLGDLLVSMSLVSERSLVVALGDQLELGVADLKDQDPPPEALAALPERVARELVAIPVRITEDLLDIAVADPNSEVFRALRDAVGRPIRLLIATRTEILQSLDRLYRALDDVSRYVLALQGTERGSSGGAVSEGVEAGDSPIGQIVDRIVTQALRDRASDVHIEPQDSILRVRFRVDGALHDAIQLPIDIAPALVSRLKILADMNIVERRRPQDGQIALTIDGRPIDVRVATTATIWGENCVLRILDKSRALMHLDSLGMPAKTHEIYQKIVRAPFGMVLCAGPTGSGKTTTLYATVAEINEPDRNIMTIEDPVEYILPSINQIQMNEGIGITFATGLRSILRQDPDIILVGEIRDVETARIAVQSALTGHFVLSSLHATDAVAALHRFLDMGIESFLIASSVLAIVGQRLVRQICTYCREPYQPTVQELAFYLENGGNPKSRFVAGAGCNFCSDTGYLGRVGVYELLSITPEIRRLVVGWATQEELRRMAASQGMRTLKDEALALVDQDVTTISEVVRTIYAI
jgi:type IV pilus assembly protein PilB